MPSPQVREVECWSGSPVWIFSRIVTPRREPVTSLNCTSFDVIVFDGIGDDALEIARVDGLTTSPATDTEGRIFDTLQTDVLLDDGRGYNFLFALTDALFEAEGDRTYRVEFKFHGTESTIFPLYDVWKVATASVLEDSA